MMRLTLVHTLLGSCLLAVMGYAAPGPDDDDDEEAREVAEKMDRCLKSATESQRKAAERTARRQREAAEKLTEEQHEAREKERKTQRAEAKRAAKARADATKFDDETLEEFDDAVDDYVKLHRKAAKSLAVPEPGPQATAEQIVTHQRALAQAIRALRATARPGDLFRPDTLPIFRRIIAAELAGRAGASARRTMLEGNPPVEVDRDDRMPVKVAVNATYPEAAPVSTVPPSVLLTLPPIPADVVEYRFVNRDLVLRDVAANMVIDYITRASPPLTPTATAGR